MKQIWNKQCRSTVPFIKTTRAHDKINKKVELQRKVTT
jgi:hypothetical protein